MTTSPARTADPGLASPAARPAEAEDAAPTASPSSQRPATGSVDGQMREFLAWVSRRPRTYADAMEAWRSHCPRYTVWEDARDAEFIRVEAGDGKRFGEARVVLTPRGRVALEDHELARRATGRPPPPTPASPRPDGLLHDVGRVQPAQ